MGLESSFNFIDDLDSTNPAAGDDISEGDDHLRGTKNAVKGSFPSLGSAAVTKTAAQINDLVDKSTTQTISGTKTFTANVLLEKAEPQLLIKCADEATENTVIRFLDETDVSRSLLFRPAGTDKVRLDARDSLGVSQAALELTEAGDVDVAVGTFTATSAALTSPVINTGVSGTAGVSRMILETVVATTSGATADFTGIPSWVKKITVTINGVSTSGTSELMMQIGDSGGFEITGYNSVGASIAGGTTSSTQAVNGFVLGDNVTAIRVYDGVVTLALHESSTFTWCHTGNIGDDNGELFMSAGRKALSAALDRLRLTTRGGTDTFDAGQVNITYEG